MARAQEAALKGVASRACWRRRENTMMPWAAYAVVRRDVELMCLCMYAPRQNAADVIPAR